MTTLTPSQLLFVVHVTGENFQTDLSNLASDLAHKTGLDYNREGKIIIEEKVDPKELRLALQSIGMRIPKGIREKPEEILEFFQKYGRLYSHFKAAQTELYRDEWLSSETSNSFVNRPMIAGTDIYLNLYLETHLKDMYTDFDLFDLFPDLSPELGNREMLVGALMEKYRPAGNFWFSFKLSGEVHLRHEYLEEFQTYTTLEGIKSISFYGKLFFREIPLAHIGLYQLALLCKPDYAKKSYRVELEDEHLALLEELYRHFLQEIKLAEHAGEQKIRFSPLLSEFNADLSF